MSQKTTQLNMSRRGIIKSIGTGLVMAPAIISASPAQAFLFRKKDSKQNDKTYQNRERSLSIVNKNTNERYTGTYWKNGYYVPDELAKFDYLLRDHRQNKTRPIDTDLIDLAHDLHMIFDQKEINVVSCYRTKKTNDMLRRRSGKVAKNSYHMKGMAMDLRVPGVPTKAIRNAAKTMSVGGVGWYPRQGFVHIDTGPIRYW